MIVKIRTVFCEIIQMSEDQLTFETRLKEDLMLDSLTVLELVMDLENVFDIKIEDQDLKKLVTFGDVAEMIKSKL